MDRKKYVAVLSSDNAGGVRNLNKYIQGSGYSTLLISDQVDDLNAGNLDCHVVVDWTVPSQELTDVLRSSLSQQDLTVVGVVNLLEPLFACVPAVSAGLGIESGTDAVAVLADKSRMRSALEELGLTRLWHHAGSPGDFGTSRILDFPAVVKPARQSGGSLHVYKAQDYGELMEALDRIALDLGTDTDVVVEKYFPGVEFSVDGFVDEEEFHLVFAAEKTGHGDELFHDVGVTVIPPKSNIVVAALSRAQFTIEQIARSVLLDRVWVHAEFRVNESGDLEVMEINPRPAGGVYPKAAEYLTGVNPLQTIVALSTGNGASFVKPDTLPAGGHLGHISFEVLESGTVIVDEESVEYLSRRDDVVAIDVLSPYRNDKLNQENFFCSILVSASEFEELLELEVEIRNALKYTLKELY